jgi:hypothetical protein
MPHTSSDGTPSSGALTGPWVQAFWFELGFPVISKSNFRRGHTGESNTWSKVRNFERSTGVLARSVQPIDWELGDREAGVSARPVVVVQIFADTLLDSGNISKSILDALEGIVFHTDASVAFVGSLTKRSRSTQRCFVAIARLEPGSTARDVSTAQIELSKSLLNHFTTQESDSGS